MGFSKGLGARFFTTSTTSSSIWSTQPWFTRTDFFGRPVISRMPPFVGWYGCTSRLHKCTIFFSFLRFVFFFFFFFFRFEVMTNKESGFCWSWVREWFKDLPKAWPTIGAKFALRLRSRPGPFSRFAFFFSLFFRATISFFHFLNFLLFSIYKTTKWPMKRDIFQCCYRECA